MLESGNQDAYQSIRKSLRASMQEMARIQSHLELHLARGLVSGARPGGKESNGSAGAGGFTIRQLASLHEEVQQHLQQSQGLLQALPALSRQDADRYAAQRQKKAAAAAAQKPASPISSQADPFIVYCDGSCRSDLDAGSGGPGGWGVLFLHGSQEQEWHGSEFKTTHNRMELMAAIEAIKAMERMQQPFFARIHTDSQYVQTGISERVHGWKDAGWKKVKNIDLWKELYRFAHERGHQIEWVWVPGHSGIEGNERADLLARSGTQRALGILAGGVGRAA